MQLRAPRPRMQLLSWCGPGLTSRLTEGSVSSCHRAELRGSCGSLARADVFWLSHALMCLQCH